MYSSFHSKSSTEYRRAAAKFLRDLADQIESDEQLSLRAIQILPSVEIQTAPPPKSAERALEKMTCDIRLEVSHATAWTMLADGARTL